MTMAAVVSGGFCGALQKHRIPVLLGLLQLAFILLFSFTTSYPGHEELEGLEHSRFNGFQDAHLGIVVGLGLLVCFLKRYAASGIGFHLLLVALVLQWGIFVHEWMTSRGGRVLLGMDSLLVGDFACLTVLVSLGAVLGKLGPAQLIVMAMAEVVFCAINHYVGRVLFQAVDSGFAMYTHVFGAFFGLAVSRMTHAQHHIDHPQATRSYNSDMMSLVGTLLLWVCFPGLNSALCPGGGSAEVAMVNTVLALAAATITTVALTTFCHPDQRFQIIHLQNAVLAGGVGIGTSAHIILKPYGALIIGAFSAAVCVFGFSYIQPFFERRLKATDTRSVLSVHGLPGLVGGLASVLIAGLASHGVYGDVLFLAIPAMAPANATLAVGGAAAMVEAGEMEWGLGRNGLTQAGFQAAALGATFVISVVGGIMTGAFLRLGLFHQLSAEEVFDDGAQWAVSGEGLPAFTVYVAPPEPPKEEPKEEELELQPKEDVNE